MSDYIPSKREPRRAWLQNISDKAAAQVVAGGGTAPVATNLTTAADALIAAYDDTDSAKTTYEAKKPWKPTRRPRSSRSSAASSPR
jgi:hypothetical protein